MADIKPKRWNAEERALIRQVYDEGYQAYESGMPRRAVPYRDKLRREKWLEGWDDAQPPNFYRGW